MWGPLAPQGGEVVDAEGEVPASELEEGAVSDEDAVALEVVEEAIADE